MANAKPINAAAKKRAADGVVERFHGMVSSLVKKRK